MCFVLQMLCVAVGCVTRDNRRQCSLLVLGNAALMTRVKDLSGNQGVCARVLAYFSPLGLKAALYLD